MRFNYCSHLHFFLVRSFIFYRFFGFWLYGFRVFRLFNSLIVYLLLFLIRIGTLIFFSDTLLRSFWCFMGAGKYLTTFSYSSWELITLLLLRKRFLHFIQIVAIRFIILFHILDPKLPHRLTSILSLVDNEWLGTRFTCIIETHTDLCLEILEYFDHIERLLFLEIIFNYTEVSLG